MTVAQERATAFNTGRGWLAGIAGLMGALGALSFAPTASAVPASILNTGGCVTTMTPTTQTCSQHGAATIFSQADLTTLTATAQIDNNGPYSFLASASVTYYLELVSNTGVFGAGTIPLLMTMHGSTDVGGTPPTVGAGFNSNKAEADVKFDTHSVQSACAGFGCGPYPSSFGGTYQIDVSPFGSVSPGGSNFFQVFVGTRAETNSNFPSSYAHAFADPYIEIAPDFLATHPEYSLSFSEGVTNPPPVPEPSVTYLLGSGLLGLTAVARRQRRRAQV